MSDPFPEDNLEGSLGENDPAIYRMPEAPEHNVYDKSRYIYWLAPYTIYIPRREIMMKIMRACIGVTHPD